MKVIKADWEKRNLGISCTEIEIESTDDISQVSGGLQSIDDEYMVVKVPYGMAETGFFLQEQGFRYIESNIQLGLRMKEKPDLPAFYKRYEPYIELRQASDEEIREMLKEIRSGKIFKTDRIALDPYFSAEQAGCRYACWIEDLLSSGNCRINLAAYKGKNTAFGIVSDKEHYCDAVLGGLFDTDKAGGMGFLSVYTNTAAAYQNASKTVKTRVSSNNLPILKLHMLFGYQIENLMSTYIKHK